MKILITNDDSIKSPGLWELVRLAKAYGEIKVIAPAHEQSGKSHGINIHDGLELRKFDSEVKSFSLNSLPADCVRVASYGLDWEFDIVLSGINNGLNLGEDIFYSGTCAAATEAAMMGKKALAFSAPPGAFKVVSTVFNEIMEFLISSKLFENGNLFNINVPAKPKGIKLTFQGKNHYDTRFVPEDELYYQRGRHHFEKEEANINSDVWAIYNNYISVTPMNYDRTDYQIYQKFSK